MQKRLLWTIWLNILITLSQIIGGIVSGSMALISDATHNFSDVISLIISYIANKWAHQKEQTIDKTFGYKRAEIVAASINGAILLVLAVFLVNESIHRFLHPKEINSNIVIYLALLSIILNTVSVVLLKEGSKDNLNIKSAYVHLLSDVFTSIVVLIGGLLIKYYQWYFIDPVMSIIIAIYLIYISWGILKDSMKIIMHFAPKNIKIEEVEQAIIDLPSVKNMHHVHLWQLNDEELHLEAHIEFNKDIKLSEFDQICERIEKILKDKFNINHTYLQPEWHRDDPKDYIIKD
jgi:cobalt-zinc-cadmium efflux system protein